MNVFDFMIWDESQRKLRAKQKELHEQLAKFRAEFEAEKYASIAREHLMAGGQDASDELINKMAHELAEANKRQTYEWKRPRPEVIDLGDEEQMSELATNFDLHLHDILEQLGYGPYSPK